MKSDGLIIKSNSGFYDVLLATNEIISAKTKGILRHQEKEPIVGDFVIVRKENNQYLIQEIKKRKNVMVRPKVANIDCALVFVSATQPEFQAFLLDKFLAVLTYLEVDKIIIVTKMDLLAEDAQLKINLILQYYQELGIKVYDSLQLDEQQLLVFKESLSGGIYTVIGQTGVGKSTFLNKIAGGNLKLETNQISQALGRGKHTTRIVELHKVADFWIADTPGFSSFDLTYLFSAKTLHLGFQEFSDYSCRFNDCVHINERGCGVKSAVETGEILLERYQNYVKMYDELLIKGKKKDRWR